MNYVGKGNPADFSPQAGFKIQNTQLANYALEGSDIIKTKEDKTLLRMCYTSLNKDETSCIDCYQAPSGLLSFGKTATRVVTVANGQTARLGEIDGQSAVMISTHELDTLFVSPIGSKKLFDLVVPSV